MLRFLWAKKIPIKRMQVVIVIWPVVIKLKGIQMFFLNKILNSSNLELIRLLCLEDGYRLFLLKEMVTYCSLLCSPPTDRANLYHTCTHHSSKEHISRRNNDTRGRVTHCVFSCSSECVGLIIHLSN